MESIEEIVSSREGFRGVDLLLTAEWPRGVATHVAPPLTGLTRRAGPEGVRWSLGWLHWSGLATILWVDSGNSMRGLRIGVWCTVIHSLQRLSCRSWYICMMGLYVRKQAFFYSLISHTINKQRTQPRPLIPVDSGN